MNKIFLLVILITCSGCIDLGRQQSRQAEVIKQETPVVPVVIPANTASRDDVQTAIKEVRTDATSSNNAVQGSLTGIGANIGKLAEKIQGFGGDLARIDTALTTRIDTSIRATADLRAEMTNTLDARINATAMMSNQAFAEMKTRVDAMVQGQVGLNNRIESMQQTVSAGRDSMVSTVQFDQKMADTLKASYDSMLRIVWIMCGMVVTLQELSRRRAEGRFREATGKVGSTCDIGMFRRLWRSVW